MFWSKYIIKFIIIITLVFIFLTPNKPVDAATDLSWFTCGACPETPEVSISGDSISLGIFNKSEYNEQNNSKHGASAILPPADKYTITFEYSLYTWDSYNPISSGWTGYWDSFSISVTDQPYWQIALSDPVTPNNLQGLGFIWGGNQYADGNLEWTSGKRTVNIYGNSSGNNYLNVILDTATTPNSNHLFPSWGNFTIIEIKTDNDASITEQAVNLAKAVVGADYIYGGEGWNYEEELYVGEQKIFDGYYYDPGVFGKGLDCSGLIFWSYNKASGATQMYGGPVKSRTADAQFNFNTVSVNESSLIPGDLLFFDWNNDGRIDHVAMYVGNVGNYDVIHASEPGVGIIWDKKDVMKLWNGFRGFRRIIDSQTGLIIKSNSPITLTVTDPDGYTITPNTLIETLDEGWVAEIPGILYYHVGGDNDDLVISPILKSGTYNIFIEPKPGALPTDTYSLEVEGAAKLIVLAQDNPINNIPPIGYSVISTGDEIIPGKIYYTFMPIITR